MSWQMCPSPECELWRQPTKLKGGCDCGEPLVPYLSERLLTVPEMARLVSAVSLGQADLPNLSVEEARRELERSPEMQECLQRRMGQLEADGGVEALAAAVGLIGGWPVGP